MADYTIELKDIINSGHIIFDFPYDFYDETKRYDFEQAFIKHFYFREIGTPTVDRFKFYLEEKMINVFPYYNELFRTAQIKYDILNNYDVTEKYRIDRESSEDATNKLEGRSTAETSEDRTLTGSGSTETEQAEDNKLTSSSTDTNASNTTNSGNENVTNESERSENGTENIDTDASKRYLDTPHGIVSLKDKDYLTNLTEDENTTDRSHSGTENSNSSQATINSSESTTNVNATNESESAEDKKLTSSSESTTSESVKDDITNTSETEQNTTFNKKGVNSEIYERTMVGNIGVMTASDLLTKHIELQKILKKIEKLFFEECEDLFMLVF